jgi:hypothetical protein
LSGYDHAWENLQDKLATAERECDEARAQLAATEALIECIDGSAVCAGMDGDAGDGEMLRNIVAWIVEYRNPALCKIAEAMTFPYALEKRLKDAGWPQPRHTLGNLHALGGRYLRGDDGSYAFAPSTDQLIGALGDYLIGTYRNVNRCSWVAHGSTSPARTAECTGEGPTLRIALAELWLTPEVQEAIKKQGH